MEQMDSRWSPIHLSVFDLSLPAKAGNPVLTEASWDLCRVQRSPRVTGSSAFADDDSRVCGRCSGSSRAPHLLHHRVDQVGADDIAEVLVDPGGRLAIGVAVDLIDGEAFAFEEG